MAVNQLIDSVNMYIETQVYPYLGATSASCAYQNVAATATQTINGSDVVNTVQEGLAIMVNFTSVTATVTMAINLQAKDPATGLYATIARCSLDGLTTGNVNSPYFWSIYPGIAATNGVNQGATPNSFYTSGIIPRVFRVQASLTATASAGSPLMSYTMSLQRT